MCALPIVSVIMPVYNAERYLHEAIKSILVQTCNNFELLIINDGSSDSSMEIAQSYADRRIRVLDEPHQGLVVALNKGLAEARGEYIARMDADDISVPVRLEKQVEYLKAHDDTVMVGSWARLIDAAGNPIGTCRTVPTQHKQIHVALCRANQFIHGSIMMRRDVALAVGGYRTAFVTSEDYDLWLRLSEIGTLANLPLALYRLRIHDGSKTAGEGAKKVVNYASHAQQAALQRLLNGRDHLGYVRPSSLEVTKDASLHLRSGLSMVTLSDWVQIYLWQGQIKTSLYFLRRALTSQSQGASGWSLIGPSYMSMWRTREQLLSVRRAWRRYYKASEAPPQTDET